VLPTELRPLVTSARETEIEVAPWPPGRAGQSLTDILGSILPAEHPEQRKWVVRMLVIVTRLTPTRLSGEKPLPLQWPVDVLIDGEPFMGRREEKQ
jgi:hypothetical protein